MTKTGTLKITTPSDCEIMMTRVLNAPRHLVFDAWTKPELVRRWLGVRAGWWMATCEIDLKVGGVYHFVWRHESKDAVLGVHGVYREIVAPERLVSTESFDDPWFPGESLVTTVLVEQGGETTVTTTLGYESREARDVVLKSGMERGVGESYDALAELLPTLAGPGEA
jgi:uncharacterized protein YndB with AHSA1/START domain